VPSTAASNAREAAEHIMLSRRSREQLIAPRLDQPAALFEEHSAAIQQRPAGHEEFVPPR